MRTFWYSPMPKQHIHTGRLLITLVLTVPPNSKVTNKICVKHFSHCHLPHFLSIAPSVRTQTLLERLSIVASFNSTVWVSSLSSYLNTLTSNPLPARVQSFINTHVTPLLKASAVQSQSPPSDRVSFLLTDYTNLWYTSIAATLLGIIYFLYSMTSYGRSAFGPRRGRQSAFTSDPWISEYFEYLGPEHYEPRPRQHDNRPSVARSYGYDDGYDDGEGPDIILLRHMNKQHTLLFKPFAISDGILRVGDIREFAAETLRREEETLRGLDPSRLRLLYKGKQLKHDKWPAKEYGLKQQSEIMVVVSESPPSRPNSDSETEESGSAVSHSSKRAYTQSRKPKNKRSRDNLVPPPPEQIPLARRRSRRGSRAPSPHPNAPPSPSSQPTPPQSPPLTSPKSDAARIKVDQLASVFHTQWVPKCVQFLLHPPSDARMRDQEHKMLSESILAQVLLKADNIDLEGDGQARTDRKKLIDEINDMFKNLDVAAKGRES